MDIATFLSIEDIGVEINDLPHCTVLGRSLYEFIMKVLNDINAGGEVLPGSLDLSNLCEIAKMQAPSFKVTLAFLRDSPDHKCNRILVMYLKQFSAMAAEVFPKTATKIMDVEMSFGVGVKWSGKKESNNGWASILPLTTSQLPD